LQRAEVSDIPRCIAPDLLVHGDTEISPNQDVSVTANAQMLGQFPDAFGRGHDSPAAIEAGAIGCNPEDSFPANGSFGRQPIKRSASDVPGAQPTKQRFKSFLMLGGTCSSRNLPNNKTTRWCLRRLNEHAHMRRRARAGFSRRAYWISY
jgi:hypothetical protein